jgi:hypothetical protein
MMVVVKDTRQKERSRMTIFKPAMARVKCELVARLPESLIHSILADCDDRRRKRRTRLLTPAVSVYLLLLQLLYQSALSGLRHLHGLSVTASAICQARSRLPLKLLRGLLAHLASAAGAGKESCFHGLQVWIADATSVQSQDTRELAGHYRQPRNQHGLTRGYPAIKALCLVHMATGMITRVIDLPWRRQEAMVLGRLIGELAGKAGVLLGDRALASFAFLHRLSAAGINACLRLSSKQIATDKKHSSRRIVKTLSKRSGLIDQLVCWHKSERPCASLSRRAYAALPQTLTLRQIQWRVDRPGSRSRWITVITTLLDPKKYPAQEIAALYLQRWQIEVYFRDLKVSQGMQRMSARTLTGARRELLGHVLLYNLVRTVMREAARRQKVPADRISYKDALRWLRLAADDGPATLLINQRRRRPAEPRRIKYPKQRYLPLKKTRDYYRKKLRRLT